MNSRRIRSAAVAALTIALVAGWATAARPPSSLALLTDSATAQAGLTSGGIFPGERVTTAFEVRDHSSGVDVDASSAFAFASDGRVAITAAWAASFASNRYVELDLNSPLPAGLALSSASFNLRFSSAASAGVACHWFEVRRASTDEVLSSHGSAAAPVGCASGTTFSSSTTAIPTVSITDLANDLRIRVHASDSATAAMRIDLATVSGSTSYAAFELYPLMFRDAADSTPADVPWELAAP